MQSVELLLDEVAHDAVVRQWQALADAGLPSQARHQGATNAPHVTIGLASSIEDSAEARLAATVRALPVPVTIGAPVLFGGARRVVLVRMVVVTAELLALHRAVSAALAGCPGRVDQLAVGQWVPHVTLARRLEAVTVPAALQALSEAGGDVLLGRATAMRRWDSDAKQAWTVGA
ncbi:MAG TPA: 2'-5' RNA ligase family protein [Ornithinimicrobium sp.]|uniref:2'-5' RNA ligase family protein n=1 Tax=Ornithinimicrobium sp. TaxID=1977084 RepID=UPI002B471291|nr:2'-5' RNA ligase family protein [Ornithinimicrobium sp.]HKJ11237.1 2'-5' RNA ligase family protein [Ornithinimicrobium sp.]